MEILVFFESFEVGNVVEEKRVIGIKCCIKLF